MNDDELLRIALAALQTEDSGDAVAPPPAPAAETAHPADAGSAAEAAGARPAAGESPRPSAARQRRWEQLAAEHGPDAAAAAGTIPRDGDPAAEDAGAWAAPQSDAGTSAPAARPAWMRPAAQEGPSESPQAADEATAPVPAAAQKAADADVTMPLSAVPDAAPSASSEAKSFRADSRPKRRPFPRRHAAQAAAGSGPQEDAAATGGDVRAREDLPSDGGQRRSSPLWASRRERRADRRRDRRERERRKREEPAPAPAASAPARQRATGAAPAPADAGAWAPILDGAVRRAHRASMWAAVMAVMLVAVVGFTGTWAWMNWSNGTDVAPWGQAAQVQGADSQGVEVLRVKTPVKAGAKITASDLVVASADEASVPADAVGPNDADAVVGKTAAIDLSANTTVTQAMVGAAAGTARKGAASDIAANSVAVSLGADETNAQGGVIRKGDTVNVYALAKDAKGRGTAAVIASSAPVISPTDTDENAAGNVTLSVSQQTAEKILAAEATGSVRVTLNGEQKRA